MSKLLAQNYDLEVHEQFKIKGHLVTAVDFSECTSALNYMGLPREFVINGIVNHYSTTREDVPKDAEAFDENFVFADEFFINLEGPISFWGKIKFKSKNKKTTAFIHHIHIELGAS